MTRVLAFALLVAACGAHGGDSAEEPPLAEQDLTEKGRQFQLLHSVGTYGDVELRSDVAVADDVAERACALARAGIGFDATLLGVRDRPEAAPGFVFGLASEAITQGRDGAATLDRNDFIGPLKYFMTAGNSYATYLVGHELTHMTMMRLGAPVNRVPVYVNEGLATSLGLWFAHTEHVPFAWASQELAPVTRADAESILATYRAPSSYAGHTPKEVGHAEHVGGLFVEWLRAHVNEHTHHAFGAIGVRIGAGETFEQAFGEELGLTLGLAELRFLDFVGATEGDPVTRFRGTILE